MPDAWRHQRADGTCALLLSRFCAGSRRAAAPLFSPLDIDDILFRDRYALLREEMEVDRFLKWRGDNVRNIFPRIGMLFEPFEMRIIPFPSINMEFRAVAHPTPSSLPVSRRRSGHRPVPSSGDNGIFLTISRTPRTLPP